MLYRVTIDGIERALDVEVSPRGTILVRIDGEVIDADVVQVPDGLSIRLGHRVFDIALGGPLDRLEVRAGDAMRVASVISPRTKAKQGRGGGALGGSANELRAPMPGRVLKVLVAVGDRVEVGTPCVVIEAMKMENELLAASAATVREVFAKEGISVEGQTLLIAFDV